MFGCTVFNGNGKADDWMDLAVAILVNDAMVEVVDVVALLAASAFLASICSRSLRSCSCSSMRRFRSCWITINLYEYEHRSRVISSSGSNSSIIHNTMNSCSCFRSSCSSNSDSSSRNKEMKSTRSGCGRNEWKYDETWATNLIHTSSCCRFFSSSSNNASVLGASS